MDRTRASLRSRRRRAGSLALFCLVVAAGCLSLSTAASSQVAFTIQNRPVGDFAAWAATSGVEVVTGDFNGDGRTDIGLVRQEPGWSTIPVALSTNDGFIVQNRFVGDFAGWAATSGVQVITGDFDGDGRTDIALVRQEPGWSTVPVALSTNDAFLIQNRPVGDFAGWATASGVEVVTGDYNRDRRTDIALVRQDVGWNTIPVALSSPTGFTIQNRPVGDFAGWAATSGVQIIKGDFNRDGRTDIGLVRLEPGWASVPVALSTDDGFLIQNRPAGVFAGWAATSGVEVVTGDYNRDRRTDIALVRQEPGWNTIPVALSRTSGFIIQNRPVGDFAIWAATSGVLIVTGDFNRDRRTDIGLVRQEPGWSTVPLALSRDNSFIIRNPGVGDFAVWAATSGVLVITGDFNGDGRTDIGLVRQEPGWNTVPVALASP
jgi:hypothetical protein